MTILIVDDQTSVVSGIVAGVNWDRLGIGILLTAYSAQEAKLMFQKQKIDILLCDIEMPVEDGISLFRWVRGNGYRTLAIFLTAHADFLYAREALRLGGFDYIVQPARYEDIEAVLQKAVIQIDFEKKKKKYYSYGKLWYEKKELLLEGLLRNWLVGEYIEEDEPRTALSNLGIRESTDFYIILFSVVGWEKGPLLEGRLLRYTFENILTELFESCGMNVVLIQLREAEYGVLVYSEEREQTSDIATEKEILRRQLRVFWESCHSLFQCRVACYFGQKQDIGGWQAGGIEELQHLQADNVTESDGVYDVADTKNKEKNVSLTFRKQWIKLLEEGYVQNVKDDMFRYLEQKAEEGILTGKSLKLFYHEFMNMIFHVAEEKRIEMRDIFLDDTNMDLSFTAYSSLEKMKEFMENVLVYFESAVAGEDSMEGQIAKIVRYIHDNIENDIRRTDIAEKIYLNPDYVSRIFKKEMGVSLKEFIIGEKMKVAQMLLRTTNLSVSLIAAKVGYTNFSHFSQTYKKVMNRTPAEERQ